MGVAELQNKLSSRQTLRASYILIKFISNYLLLAERREKEDAETFIITLIARLLKLIQTDKILCPVYFLGTIVDYGRNEMRNSN